MSRLRERLSALLEESAEEIEALKGKRATLQAERDAEIAAIRERYTAQFTELNEELAAAERIRKALEGPKPKEAKPAPQRQPRHAPKFRPGDDKLLAVLRAVANGLDTVADIDGGVDFSRGSVENAVLALREDGSIRLSGERRVKGTNAKARTYALTPAGEEAIRELVGRMNGATA